MGVVGEDSPSPSKLLWRNSSPSLVPPHFGSLPQGSTSWAFFFFAMVRERGREGRRWGGKEGGGGRKEGRWGGRKKYYEELTHVIMEAEKSHDLMIRPLQAGDPGEPGMKFESLRSPGLKAENWVAEGRRTTPQLVQSGRE